MSVKPIHSAVRVLDALEIIARHQPLGVAELARRLEGDKSAAQRVLATLSSAGWIKAVPEGVTRWELTSRLLTVASEAHNATALAQQLHPLIMRLRDGTGETVICAVPDIDRVVVTDVAESTQMVRFAPPVGFVVPTQTSASGRALLSAMDRTARENLCGHSLPEAEHKKLDAIKRRGWSLSVAGDSPEGATSVGVAVIGRTGVPVAAVAISGVSTRMPRDVQKRFGALLARSIADLPLP